MRINFYGGPGAGKSIIASDIKARMGRDGYNIELVHEYVKSWACQKRPVHKFNQVYLLGKQMEYEYRWLVNGIDHIVTDSPVLLVETYLHYNFASTKLASAAVDICLEYEIDYPSINVILDRDGILYDANGRYQTFEQAQEIDRQVERRLLRFKQRMEAHGHPFEYVKMSPLDPDAIYDYILSKIA